MRSASLLLLLAAGCSSTPRLMESPRLSEGLIAILIHDVSERSAYAALADGFNEGGVRWGVGILEKEGEDGTAMDRILEYREEYPGKPVWLVGHSDGAGLVLNFLNELPGRSTVDGVILLAPDLAPKVNLAPYLRRSRKGIWNFHSPNGTGAAGPTGFVEPEGLEPSDRDLYRTELHQGIGWSRDSYGATSRRSCARADAVQR
ncbi:MAG: serine aminopeptidase domain-containing protein [Planctomycetota bacterium]